MTRQRRTVLSALAVALLAGACGTTGTNTNRAPTTSASTTSVPTTPSQEDAWEMPSVPEQTQPEYPYLGESFAWDNGLTVTLSKPKPYTPSQYVLEYEDFPYKSFVVVTVTVANGSLEPYDPSQFMESVQSGDVESSELYDTDNGIGEDPQTRVLPGHKVSWKFGYNVKDPKDVTVEVTPGFDYESVLWLTK